MSSAPHWVILSRGSITESCPYPLTGGFSAGSLSPSYIPIFSMVYSDFESLSRMIHPLHQGCYGLLISEKTPFKSSMDHTILPSWFSNFQICVSITACSSELTAVGVATEFKAGLTMLFLTAALPVLCVSGSTKSNRILLNWMPGRGHQDWLLLSLWLLKHLTGSTQRRKS